jgi:4'-phosphopantetheinyl transferase
MQPNALDAMIDVALVAETGSVSDDALIHWSLPADDFPGSRRRSRVARALLRRMLVHATGIPSEEWTFDAEPSGRPIARNIGYRHIPSVSLSHSGGWVACAISFATAVGIDIEVYNSRRDFTRIAAATFGPEEQMVVAAEGESAFYRIWTLKEAMAKASGAGIAEVADRTDRVAKTPKEGAWRQRVGTTSWWLAHETPVSGLSLAVALLDVGTV